MIQIVVPFSNVFRAIVEMVHAVAMPLACLDLTDVATIIELSIREVCGPPFKGSRHYYQTCGWPIHSFCDYFKGCFDTLFF